MFGVFADHPDDPFSLNNFAFITDFFNRSSYFHALYPTPLENLAIHIEDGEKGSFLIIKDRVQ
jgi:hypothetical protein